MVASPDRWHFLAGNFSKSTTPTPVTGDQRPVFNAMCAEDFRRQSVRQLNLQAVCNLIGNVESSPEYASKFSFSISSSLLTLTPFICRLPEYALPDCRSFFKASYFTV